MSLLGSKFRRMDILYVIHFTVNSIFFPDENLNVIGFTPLKLVLLLINAGLNNDGKCHRCVTACVYDTSDH